MKHVRGTVKFNRQLNIFWFQSNTKKYIVVFDCNRKLFCCLYFNNHNGMFSAKKKKVKFIHVTEAGAYNTGL